MAWHGVSEMEIDGEGAIYKGEGMIVEMRDWLHTERLIKYK